MEKVSVQAKTVVPIAGISVVQFLQYFQFSQARFMPALHVILNILLSKQQKQHPIQGKLILLT